MSVSEAGRTLAAKPSERANQSYMPLCKHQPQDADWVVLALTVGIASDELSALTYWAV